MKRSTLVLTTLILIFQVTLEAIAQKKSTEPTFAEVVSMMPHPDYVSQLLSEINTINKKTERLKQKMATEPVQDQLITQTKIKELEEKSINKQIEAASITLSVNVALYNQKKIALTRLQNSNPSKENQMHINFLVNDAAKNKKMALELLQENAATKNSAMRLGSLDNGQEKILLALKQQEEAFSLLEKGGAKIAQNVSTK